MAKKKAWEAFRGILPTYQGEPERIDIIQQRKEDFAKTYGSNEELAKLLRDLKNQKDKLKEALSLLEIDVEACTGLLHERMTAQGMEKFTISGGETFYIQDAPYPQVKDREKLNIWIMINGMDELRSVHPKTLEGIVKERLKSGENPPDGVEVYMKSTVKMLKG